MRALMERHAAVVSKHGKIAQIAPALAAAGWELAALELDTDVLGTFTGAVPRLLPPLETCREKALLGVSVADHEWFIASEGTITPWAAGIHSDTEIVVLVHRTGVPLIVGRATSFDITLQQLCITSESSDQEIITFCEKADLGTHHLIAYDNEHLLPSLGALRDVEDVLQACRHLRARSSVVMLQTDLRAHLCPSRQPVIESAANDLGIRVTTACPRCSQPGFGTSEPILGLPCEACGSPSKEPRGWHFECPWCSHHEREVVPHNTAPSSLCMRCNP